MEKDVILNSIINDMTGILTEEQISALKQSVIIAFHDYNISDSKNEIVEYEDCDRFLIQQYYASLSIEGKRKKTIERYMSQLKTMIDWIKKPLRDITTEDIRYYLAIYQQQRKVSNTTLDGMRKCICAFFSWAEFSEYIDKSPARRIKGIKHDTVPEPALTSGEIEKAMIHCHTDRDKAIINFMYETGARVSEVSNVKLDDIDFKENTVVLHGKGNKDRVAFFTDKSLLYIGEYIKSRKSNSSILFESKRGGALTNSGIQSMIRKLGEESEIEHLHPHRFRVSRITHLVDRGMPLQDVQELAGHSDINTTRRYYRNTVNNIKNSYMRAAQ